eukprot:1136358-Pelagomonas_calceolata.AAC.2
MEMKGRGQALTFSATSLADLLRTMAEETEEEKRCQTGKNVPSNGISIATIAQRKEKKSLCQPRGHVH